MCGMVFDEPNEDPSYGRTSVRAKRTARWRSVLPGNKNLSVHVVFSDFWMVKYFTKNVDWKSRYTSVRARRTARLRSELTGYRKPSRTADESKST